MSTPEKRLKEHERDKLYRKEMCIRLEWVYRLHVLTITGILGGSYHFPNPHRPQTKHWTTLRFSWNWFAHLDRSETRSDHAVKPKISDLPLSDSRLALDFVFCVTAKGRPLNYHIASKLSYARREESSGRLHSLSWSEKNSPVPWVCDSQGSQEAGSATR